MFILATALGGLSVLLIVICCFLDIDVTRAVIAKEEWKKMAAARWTRMATLMTLITENNERYQELSDKLEDYEQELADAQLNAAFEREGREAQERAAGFWARQFNETVLDWTRDCARLREVAQVLGVDLFPMDTLVDRVRVVQQQIGKLVTFEIRCCNIAHILGMSEEEAGKSCRLADAVQDVRDERNELIKERGALNTAACEALKERVEARDLLHQGQVEAAELAKDRETAIETLRETNKQLDDLRIQVGAVAQAILVGRGLYISNVAHDGSVRGYVAGRGVTQLSPDVDAIVLALDNYKEDLRTRMERLRKVEGERDICEDIAPPVPRSYKVQPLSAAKALRARNNAAGPRPRKAAKRSRA